MLEQFLFKDGGTADAECNGSECGEPSSDSGLNCSCQHRYGHVSPCIIHHVHHHYFPYFIIAR